MQWTSSSKVAQFISVFNTLLKIEFKSNFRRVMLRNLFSFGIAAEINLTILGDLVHLQYAQNVLYISVPHCTV